MIDKCIGIVSYLPADEQVREVRKTRVLSLIKQCDEWFKLPIILITQNWPNDLYGLTTKYSKIIAYKYKNKLGLTKARVALVEKFLKSPYNRIIFMDDDMILNNQEEVNKYLSSLGSRDFYYIPTWLLNFCSITRNGLSKVNFDINTDAEKQTGFEDWLFVQTCIKKLPTEKINCSLGKGTRKDYLDDKFSTWNPSGINNKYKNKNSSITSAKIKAVR